MGPEDTKNEGESIEDANQSEGSVDAGKEEAVSQAGGSPQFSNLKEVEMQSSDPKKINFLYDIKLDVNIELGRAELKVKDILQVFLVKTFQQR